MEERAVTMEKIVALCKNRGFIFPGSDIYGVLLIHGITVLSEWNSKITLRRHGGRNLYRNPNTMSDLMQLYS